MTSEYDLRYNQLLSFLTAMWFNSINNQVWNLGWTIDLYRLIQLPKSIEQIEQLCNLYELSGPEIEPENVH